MGVPALDRDGIELPASTRRGQRQRPVEGGHSPIARRFCSRVNAVVVGVDQLAVALGGVPTDPVVLAAELVDEGSINAAERSLPSRASWCWAGNPRGRDRATASLSLCRYNVCTSERPMGTTRVNFRIPEELIEKADVAGRITHKNRTEIVIEALREYLEDVEDEDRFKEELVELYLDDEIEYETLTAFVGRQDAEAVRTSKALLEDADGIVEDLAGR